MDRTRKNIIMIVIAVLLAAGMAFTAHSAAADLTFPGGPPMMQGDTDHFGGPDSNTSDSANSGNDSKNSGNSGSDSQNSGNSGGDSQNSGNSGSQDNQADQGMPPAPPDGDSNGDTGNFGSNSNNSGDSSSDSKNSSNSGSQDTQADQGMPPAPPDGNSNGSNGNQGNQSDQGMPPTPPDGNSNGNDNSGSNSNDSGNSGNDSNGPGNQDIQDNQKMPPTPPGKHGSKMDKGPLFSMIPARYYILFGAEGLAFALILMYLIMSGMNRRSFRETFSNQTAEEQAAALLNDTSALSQDAASGEAPASSDGQAPDLSQDTSSAENSASSDGFALALSQDTPYRETKASSYSRKKIAAFIIGVLLIGGALVPAQAALTTGVFADNPVSHHMQGGTGHDNSNQGGTGQDNSNQGGPGGDQQSNVEATGATTVDGTEETLNDTYTSTKEDENAILVTGGGTLTSDGATINKKSGDSSNTSGSDFSGVNAGLLVQDDSTATVKNATIKTSAKGANAVFATGEKSKVTISDSKITTTGEASSRGLDATYGGTIKADHVSITTQGGSCAAMATDRGEGTVSATDSTLETNGAGSPLIYSTGNITLTNSKGKANGAQITVVEGKNSAVIKKSSLSCSASGNRGDVDIAGVMIYQSMSGDASEGTGNFTAEDSTLSISKKSDYYKTAPMFFVTNTDAVIDLENTDLNFGSGVLLNAQGTSEWGNEGSNGGNVTFHAKAEELSGDIQLDTISTLTMDLTDSSYKGTINGDNTAKSVALTLDKDSKITLTGDSYVTSLDDADSSYSNIDFNGHTLYVNGKAIN